MASCLNNSLWTVRVWQICQQMKLGVRMGNATKLNCMKHHLPWSASAPPVPMPSAWSCHMGLSTGWTQLLSKDWRNLTLSSVPFPPTISIVRVNFKLRQKQKMLLVPTPCNEPQRSVQLNQNKQGPIIMSYLEEFRQNALWYSYYHYSPFHCFLGLSITSISFWEQHHISHKLISYVLLPFWVE